MPMPKLRTGAKKGQADYPIISIIIIIIFLLFMAPFMLKIFKAVTIPLKLAVNDTPAAVSAINTIDKTWMNFWDIIVMMTFVVSIILMIVSAFFVNTHPIFFVVYLVLTIVTFILAPSMMDTLDKVWTSPQFAGTSEETNIVSKLPFTDYLRTHFSMVLLMIVAVTGVVMFWNSYSAGRQRKKDY